MLNTHKLPLYVLTIGLKVALMLIFIPVVKAQSSLPEGLPRTSPQQEPSQPKPLPPPEQLLPSPLLPPSREENLPPSSETIIVKQFVFEGNTAFTDAELSQVVESFRNRPISFTELLAVRSAITNYYIENSYITSGALIPPQEFQSGIIKIEIVEGEIEEITVTGSGRLSLNYVRSRIKRATKKPLNQEKLLEALQLLQLDPLIQTVSAELSLGSRPGLSLLKISFETANTFSAEVFANNSRSPTVGTFERGVGVTEANLLGKGDTLSAVYSNTDGSDIVDVIYTLPINARNGSLSLYFNTSDSEVVERPFDELDIEANSRTYELRYRQPVILTPSEELTLGVTLARRESDTSILGIDFPLSRGADDDGETRLSIIRLFQEYTKRGAKQVFAARSQFSIGLDQLNSTINEDTNEDRPDSDYFAWRGQAQWFRLLGQNLELLLRSDLQFSSEELVPLEQVGLGGFETVRGYRQDELLRDNAVFASAELRYTILRTGNGEGILQLTPFLDFGRAWNNNEELGLDSETLFSVGLGLRWQYGELIKARLDWGIPLTDVDSRERTLQEEGFYFSIEVRPFD
ncbi:MAG: ShlB/FhaC/HecB family hemolysin secretion/activation protein [Okeania sp. SIO3I5]|uniref:ShlB/FhaC/HecB family hemolysin secretion/activation protein n=1 Tax=Okeania sp. SIO3I5 TaxID=2607805 RepID=UPI0013BCC8AD|nr:ShlB/FhaC/HecB family hemolysin secretion/activation protein [Okeania sp. SIO3I5]NEQ39583.1 ShlB/FhaC/HecB family hemolysin secretion/activation protein [Okeania sp. SIO3I5]